MSNYNAKVVTSLSLFLVPQFLNLGNSRARLRSHSTPISNGLFRINAASSDGQMMMIWDGTYRYVQKSANYEAQKRLWSGQKKLTKLMVGVCPDGYIGYVFGPYGANDNDATILNLVG